MDNAENTQFSNFVAVFFIIAYSYMNIPYQY